MDRILILILILNSYLRFLIVAMKRFFAIPLFVLYFIAITGVMVNLHYCGQKLYAFNLVQQTECCCENEASPAPQHSDNEQIQDEDCCSNQAVQIKITQEQLNNSWDKTPIMQEAFAILPPSALWQIVAADFYDAHDFLSSQLTHAPPGLWENIPLYRLYSSPVLYS